MIVRTNLTISILEAKTETIHCISVHIVDDLLTEGEEQFELYFMSSSTQIGENATVYVNIKNDDGTINNITTTVAIYFHGRGRGN